MTRYLPCEEIIQKFRQEQLDYRPLLATPAAFSPRFKPESLSGIRPRTDTKKQLTLPTPTITGRLEANPMHVWKQVERAEDVGTKDLHTQDSSVPELCHKAIAHS